MFKNSKVNYLVTVLLGGLLVLGIYGQYTFSSTVPRKIKIGTTYMTMNNSFYKIVNDEIEKVVDERGGTLYNRDPALSVDKQCEQIKSFISKGVDTIIINPVDSGNQKINKSLKKAKQEGIKIVVVDSQLRDKRLSDTTIISDNYKAGVLDAKKMMRTVSKADILLLEHKDTLSAVDRINGFLDTISKNPHYHVVSRKESYGQTEIAMPIVEKVIDQGVHFDVIMALNDRSAIGALAAVKEKKLKNKIYIYGVDGSPDMKSLLYNTSDVQATVAQSPISMGKIAVSTAYKLFKEEKTKRIITVPVTLIDKKNINQFDLSGWQ
ncbi:sugar ABC transporter substrate-binding protein [Streptococcus macacae]|uniref:Periplasmic binding protein and sugar binding domain of the LacI family protein n=1 Tax=Streptococcus macacae NCTC 11558 TaxID=764298 RepID=G5JV26_9STRE|nr:sugar ABC transporter substrate-binding protein [Streptococcus macacae]EHJ53128.1 periplasmic binding protein and sugar binding domain of the LacI family protein [Streptococcus macacae NCTC 11558]SUN79329.1 ribose transport system substrate-binding protein [Streptococcus macacae NCTC 11558]